MARGKELLLFLVAMTHFSSLVSQRMSMKHKMMWAMENLNKTEEVYVRHVFEAEPPQQFLSHGWNTLDGITLPVGNSAKEIQDSICAIRCYLEELPSIIGNITVSPLQEELLSDLTAFTGQFKLATRKVSSSRPCHTNILSDMYLMKEKGLKIIYFTKCWVIEFTQSAP